MGTADEPLETVAANDTLSLTKCEEGSHYARGAVRALTIRWFDFGKKEWQERMTTACGPCYTKLKNGSQPKVVTPEPR